jgi:hypothetical protein
MGRHGTRTGEEIFLSAPVRRCLWVGRLRSTCHIDGLVVTSRGSCAPGFTIAYRRGGPAATSVASMVKASRGKL